MTWLLLEILLMYNAFMKYGLQTIANPGRDLEVEYNGKTYLRLPIVTPFLEIGDDLDELLKTYVKSEVKETDILGISAKVVSIAHNLLVHESDVKISLLARIIVKFVRKWPDDIGYSHPRKMQVAIKIAGYPRTILALIVGTIMKLIGKPGYFYKIMGHNINAIDGFNPVSQPPMNEYAVLPPTNGDLIATKYEDLLGCMVVILDGNNIDNNVLGMGKRVKGKYSIKDIMEIGRDNPQGQEDDGITTPCVVLRVK